MLPVGRRFCRTHDFNTRFSRQRLVCALSRLAPLTISRRWVLMRSLLLSCLSLLAVFTFTGLTANEAHAKCTRLAFSVNDYGKEGPAKDAKRLLDDYIAKWTSERGISGYRTGKKKVTCELFIDLIVFDEYTCKAEASVCW